MNVPVLRIDRRFIGCCDWLFGLFVIDSLPCGHKEVLIQGGG
jgi:hypothetical protein